MIDQNYIKIFKNRKNHITIAYASGFDENEGGQVISIEAKDAYVIAKNILDLADSITKDDDHADL